MNFRILDLLKQKYNAEIQLHAENIKNLLSHSVGVADHPHLAETVEGELEKIASLSDKIEAIKHVVPKN